MNNKKHSSAALLAASALTVSLAGCSTVVKITDCIDSGDYDRAVELYNSSEFSYKEISSLTEKMSDRITDALEKYANGEAEYDEVTSLISALNQMNISKLDNLLLTSSAEAAALKSSKDSFESGNDAFNRESYAEALNYYALVIEKDSNYQTAVEKISESASKFKEQVLNNTRKMTDSNEYETAVEYLNECLSQTNNSDINNTINEELENVKASYADFKLKEIISKADELAEKGSFDEAVEYLNSEKNNADSDIISEECDKKISEIQKSATVKEAEDLANSEDYAEALTVLNAYKNEYNKDDTDINALQSEISEQYVGMITEKVTALCEKENYIAALNMLSNAKSVVSSPVFDEMEKKINEIKPTYLYDLKIISSERYEVIDSGEAVMDSIGNTYDVGNLFEISTNCDGWNIYNGSVNYNLGYKYTTMSGIAAVDDKSDDTNGKLVIEGDGIVLYTVDLNRLSTPVPISLDVSNVNQLKISLEYINTNGTLYTILSDFTFEK